MVGSRRPEGSVRLRGVITVVPAQLATKTQHGVLDPRGSQSTRIVPGQFDELVGRQYLPLMPGQGGQQAVLGRREDHRVAVDRDFLVGEVDVEGAVVEGDDRVVARDLAAADGLQPGEQLDTAERLGQVVVGSGVETPHLVALGAERGQHEDGHVTHVADPLEHLPAVEVGEPYVEDHDVGMALVELADAVATLVRL
jgi:hypothetical protein